MYINFSAFSKMDIYKLHLFAFYTVNECKLIDLSECIQRMKYERLIEKSIEVNS